MARGRTPVSVNRLEGSLGDTPIEKLLESCKTHLITGKIDLRSGTDSGVIELRAGAVDTARFAGAEGEAALAKLRKLDDGIYELSQHLPDLDGSLGEGATGEGDLARVPLVKMMRHCEDQALSCTITVVSEFDRAEIRYRVGEIVEVTWNGTSDLDAIVDVVKLTQGRFRLQAPPLPSDIDGWPSARKDPTVPFKIEHLARRPIKNPEAPVAEATPAADKPVAAEKPPAEKPPAEKPPAEKPPAEKPPAEKPPAEKPPAEKPAVAARLATEPPGAAAGASLSWDTALLAVIGLGVVTLWLVLLLSVG